MEQSDKLIEFRQAIYRQGLTRAQDAQFKLVDALLLSPPIRSFPELSLSPAFRRQSPSAHAAIEEGEQESLAATLPDAATAVQGDAGLPPVGELFQQIGTPASSPQPREKSPGWPRGRTRTRPDRHQVVKKTKKKA